MEVELDGRKRLAMKSITKFPAKRYRVTMNNDGSLLLEPVISLTEKELEALRGQE